MNSVVKAVVVAAAFFSGRKSKEKDIVKHNNKVLEKQRDIAALDPGNPIDRMLDNEL